VLGPTGVTSLIVLHSGRPSSSICTFFGLGATQNLLKLVEKAVLEHDGAHFQCWMLVSAINGVPNSFVVSSGHLGMAVRASQLYSPPLPPPRPAMTNLTYTSMSML